MLLTENKVRYLQKVITGIWQLEYQYTLSKTTLEMNNYYCFTGQS